ncbi:MAG: hypothetical protein ORO03_08795 [Alphaproteobacteria bacterium]|nr:hypothetical protein [Alphaproteobacteria bacterium]
MNDAFGSAILLNMLIISALALATPILLITAMTALFSLNIALVCSTALSLLISIASWVLCRNLSARLRKLTRERADYVHKIKNGFHDEVFADLYVSLASRNTVFLHDLCMMMGLFGGIGALSTATILAGLNFL